ncbi:tRNA lysidine(34) synthetase TilS [Bacillus carboniphilus]|uniref:tRNA(Ile)-lysidine synthase n=2 Tax=Bacillus carboniphilus TaxID=86663 RepID=A0ABP3FLV1_9BACI
MFDQKVHSFIKKHRLFTKGDIVVIGVSGGPDSLALLHFLNNHKHFYQLNIVAAHVDHMFRGQQSYEDYLFVQSICEKWGIPFEGKQIQVSSYQKNEKLSSQVAARNCRYTFFKEVMEKHHATKLALGHHGDDQVETILMRLTRGSTMKGRSGIPFSRTFSKGRIVRPFLSLEKSDIEDYCTEHNLNPRRDPTNEKLDYTRNRFRHQVLPFLKEENKELVKQFQRFSEELLEDEAFLEELTEQYMNKVVKRKNDGLFMISINNYLGLPHPLQRRGIHLILKYLYKDIPSTLSAVHIEQILNLFKGSHPSGILHLPKDLNVIRSYDEGIFRFGVEETGHIETTITPGETISLPNGSLLIFQEVETMDEEVSNTLYEYYVSKDTPFPLIVRSRKNGDRIMLPGLIGHKKLKDLFIDEKIPLMKRDTWPIVTNQNGEILWVPGLKKSGFEAKNSKDATYILRYSIGNI